MTLSQTHTVKLLYSISFNPSFIFFIQKLGFYICFSIFYFRQPQKDRINHTVWWSIGKKFKQNYNKKGKKTHTTYHLILLLFFIFPSNLKSDSLPGLKCFPSDFLHCLFLVVLTANYLFIFSAQFAMIPPFFSYLFLYFSLFSLHFYFLLFSLSSFILLYSLLWLPKFLFGYL